METSKGLQGKPESSRKTLLGKILHNYTIMNEFEFLFSDLKLCLGHKFRRQPQLFVSEAGLPDFSWSKHTNMGKIYQTTTNHTKRPYIIGTKWP
jgi:hypothetical protein